MCHKKRNLKKKRIMQKLKKNCLVNSKLTWRIWWFFTWALENLNNLHFNGLLLNKVYVWSEKKYRGVIFDCTADWSKIWRQTELYFLKWHKKCGKFSPEHVWKSKNWVFSWVLFQSRKCVRLKFTGQLCVMRMKNDTKFEEELTCQFKIDMSNLMDFEPSTWKSWKCAL